MKLINNQMNVLVLMKVFNIKMEEYQLRNRNIFVLMIVVETMINKQTNYRNIRRVRRL